MGMNMVTKGVHNVIEFLSDDSPDMDVIGISGEFLLYVIDNFFSDINKPAAVNCIEGHGMCLVELNILKNLTVYVDSNLQDPAQNMESSQIDGSH
ncbi:unnamed protein product [Brassica oleracea]